MTRFAETLAKICAAPLAVIAIALRAVAEGS
jgi:hypothetical protein